MIGAGVPGKGRSPPGEGGRAGGWKGVCPTSDMQIAFPDTANNPFAFLPLIGKPFAFPDFTHTHTKFKVVAPHSFLNPNSAQL